MFRRVRNRYAVPIALLMALLLAVAACGDDDGGSADTATGGDTGTPAGDGDDWSAIEEAAREEGRVEFRTTFPGTEVAVADAFREAYPDIEIVAERIIGTDLIPRLEQEAATDADGADVVLISGDWPDTAAADGRMVAPAGPQVDRWQDSEFFKDTHIVAALLPMVFGFNTNMVEPFSDWDGWLDEELRGRYAICDSEGAPVVAYNDWIRDTHGDDYIEAILSEQQPTIQRSSSAIAQALSAGEFPAALCMTPGALQPLIDEGAPVEFTIPEPAFALPGQSGIVSWSKRPNAAQVLMNFLMSPEGQTALVEGLGTSASPLDDVESADAVPVGELELWPTEDYAPEDYDQLRNEWVELMG